MRTLALRAFSLMSVLRMATYADLANRPVLTQPVYEAGDRKSVV